jgi:hypothetical protein
MGVVIVSVSTTRASCPPRTRSLCMGMYTSVRHRRAQWQAAGPHKFWLVRCHVRKTSPTHVKYWTYCLLVRTPRSPLTLRPPEFVRYIVAHFPDEASRKLKRPVTHTCHLYCGDACPKRARRAQFQGSRVGLPCFDPHNVKWFTHQAAKSLGYLLHSSHVLVRVSLRLKRRCRVRWG